MARDSESHCQMVTRGLRLLHLIWQPGGNEAPAWLRSQRREV
jgi:hypothetical protein